MVKNRLDYGCTSLSFPVTLAAIGVEVPSCIMFNGGALLSSWVTGWECQGWEVSTSPQLAHNNRVPNGWSRLRHHVRWRKRLLKGYRREASHIQQVALHHFSQRGHFLLLPYLLVRTEQCREEHPCTRVEALGGEGASSQELAVLLVLKLNVSGRNLSPSSGPHG